MYCKTQSYLKKPNPNVVKLLDAAKCGRVDEVIEIITEKDVDANCTTKVYFSKPLCRSFFWPFELCFTFQFSNYYFPLIQQLLETPMILAAQNGHLKVVQALLDVYADVRAVDKVSHFVIYFLTSPK